MFDRLIATLAFLKAMLGAANRRVAEELLRTLEASETMIGIQAHGNALAMADERGQLGLGTVLAAFTVAIAAMVVIVVLDRFNSSLGNPSSSQLNNSTNSILSGFADMAALIGPLFLIGIGVVIIGLIRRISG